MSLFPALRSSKRKRTEIEIDEPDDNTALEGPPTSRRKLQTVGGKEPSTNVLESNDSLTMSRSDVGSGLGSKRPLPRPRSPEAHVRAPRRKKKLSRNPSRSASRNPR